MDNAYLDMIVQELRALRQDMVQQGRDSRGSSFRDAIIKGNYGQTVPVTGMQWTQIAEMHLSESRTVTISSMLRPFPRAGTPQAGTPKVLLRIRAGSGRNTSAILTIAGNPKTVSGTDFYVEGQVFLDELGLVPADGAGDPDTTTDCSAYFSDGHGQDVQPTTWYESVFEGDPPTIVGNFQTALVGPCKLRQIQGYNHSANPTWLMLFDWPIPGQSPLAAPTNGQLPRMVIPIPGAQAPPAIDPWYSQDSIESAKAFTYGCAWVTSSTGNLYTIDGGGEVRVEIEFYRGEQFQGTIP